VLDVAAGAGGETLATDIAPAILEYAAADVHRAGLANVATRAVDGEQLDVHGAGHYDAVISRVWHSQQLSNPVGWRTGQRLAMCATLPGASRFSAYGCCFSA
jgi:hypothetical protein